MNGIDGLIENIIQRWEGILYLSDKADISKPQENENSNLQEDIKILKLSLILSSEILRNSFNKDIYSTTEVINICFIMLR